MNPAGSFRCIIDDHWTVEFQRVPAVGEVIVHTMDDEGHNKGAVTWLRVRAVEWNVFQSGQSANGHARLYCDPIERPAHHVNPLAHHKE